LRPFTKTLSYAKAEDLQALLTKSVLSQRGVVQVDPRTNTLIITDLPDRVLSASDLIAALDRAQPQVEIEARIVQVNKNFQRNLGVQWGFAGRVDPALGNTTGLAFPNSGGLAGAQGGTTGGLPTAVNLPVPGATSAVGLQLGSVNGAFNLDVALTALETTGNGRVLSTPRVSTQNNVEAEIKQGTQIPIQTVANNTVTVQFKDAALILKVTPQITASNTVIMKISLENGQADFTKAVNGIPPINTQSANTSVQVSDGQTTVIGGIYLSTEQYQTDRTPGLGRIPLLNWLFKRENALDNSSELLIFITPRIIKS
jgi:type IV pilus assembly protein PilQ